MKTGKLGNGFKPHGFWKAKNAAPSGVTTTGRPPTNPDEIVVYPDGGCRPNPGQGAYGVVVTSSSEIIEDGDYFPETTNNRMEIMGAIVGIDLTPILRPIVVRSDSRYLIDGITKWVRGWKRNGWFTEEKRPVLNKDLWLQLDELVSYRTIRWEWVRGHSGVFYNERADEIVRICMLNKKGFRTTRSVP